MLSLQSLSFNACYNHQKSELKEICRVSPHFLGMWENRSAVSSWDGKVKLTSLKGKSKISDFAVLSPKQSLIAFENHRTIFWNVRRNKIKQNRCIENVHTILSDTHSLATLHNNGLLNLWDKNEFKKIRTLPIPTSAIKAIQNNNLLLIATKEADLLVYDIRCPNIVSSFSTIETPTSLACSRNQLFLSSGNSQINEVDLKKPDRSVKIYDVKARSTIIEAVNNYLFTNTYPTHGHVKVINTSTDEECQITTGRSCVSEMVLDKRKNLLYLGTQRGYVQVWDVANFGSATLIKEWNLGLGFAITNIKVCENSLVASDLSNKLFSIRTKT
ncbi:MAG: hypothetical protein VX777_03060 [Chlamydiota bacterium]|nr:hypothetical protein [Chlamydiota bacterium]